MLYFIVFHTRQWSNYSLPLNAVAINVDEKSTEIIQLRQALKNEKILREVSEVSICNKELHEQIERLVAKNQQLE